MRRNFKSGVYSNNSIRFNQLSNKKTKNIVYLQDDEIKNKINCSNLYDVSVSQKTKKMLNNRNKYYKYDNEDYIIDDEDDE
jgi:ATP-dependent Clp protease ATP-binding subunit ClpA